MYNFDKVIDRRNTNCEKWDMPIQEYHNEQMIPMWVADMDFEVAKPIQNRLMKRVQHGVYGYTMRDEEVIECFVRHFNKKCNHQVKSEEVILSTGVVHTINACVQLFTNKKDKIMIHSPAYHPFRIVATNNECEIVDTKMIEKEGRYVFDFEDMEKQIDENCKIFILCNPQNPTGRVFEKEELEKIATFCEKHNLLIISDEIHADFIFDKKRFTPICDINEYTKKHTITCVSCTKTFNLAGLNVSALFIKNKDLREKFKRYTSRTGLQAINILGLEAVKAAYEECEDWLEELMKYLSENREYALHYIKEYLPQIKVLKNEATYLLWLDMSFMNVDNPQKELAEKAGVYFSDGASFGEDYNNYVRMNIACPKSQLVAALEAVKEYIYKKY